MTSPPGNRLLLRWTFRLAFLLIAVLLCCLAGEFAARLFFYWFRPTWPSEGDAARRLTLEEYLPLARTGDLLLKATEDDECSLLSRVLSRGNWTHCALVVRLPQDRDRVALFHATPNENLVDGLTGHPHGGLQVVDLADYVRSQPERGSRLYVRQLETPFAGDAPDPLAWLASSGLGRQEVPFDGRATVLGRTVFGGGGRSPLWDLVFGVGRTQRRRRRGECGYFCSQLVAAVLKDQGLLAEDQVPEGYHPVHFGEQRGHPRWRARWNPARGLPPYGPPRRLVLS